MNEFFYAFYLLSGHFDNLLAVNNINIGIDLGMLMSFVMSAVILLRIFFVSKFRIPVNFFHELLILLLVLLIALVSLLYTKSPDYSKYKTLFFAKEIILSFAYPFLVQNFDVKKFIKWFVFILFSFTTIYIYELQVLPYKNDPVYKRFVSRYLEVGIANGVVFLLMVFSSSKIYKNDFVQFSVAVLALVFLVLSSARGPAIFLIVVLIAALFIKGFSFRIKKSWLIYFFFLVFISLPFIIYVFMSNPKYYSLLNSLLSRTIMRFSKFWGFITGHGLDESTFDRILMWKFTINKIFENLSTILFGYGIGSFGVMYLGQDIRAYPHNIFLEAWFELGFVAFVLFVLFFAIPLAQGKRNPYVSSIVIFYLLLNILKSYSFADMRIVYVFMAMFIYPYVEKSVNIASVPDIKPLDSQ